MENPIFKNSPYPVCFITKDTFSFTQTLTLGTPCKNRPRYMHPLVFINQVGGSNRYALRERNIDANSHQVSHTLCGVDAIGGSCVCSIGGGIGSRGCIGGIRCIGGIGGIRCIGGIHCIGRRPVYF